jgi:hypothetical protein
MIWESGPWKDVLLADAGLLERWAVKTKVTSRRSLLIERKVFLAAYTIRKHWEAQKLSTSFRDLSFRCLTYLAISDPCNPFQRSQASRSLRFRQAGTKGDLYACSD